MNESINKQSWFRSDKKHYQSQENKHWNMRYMKVSKKNFKTQTHVTTSWKITKFGGIDLKGINFASKDERVWLYGNKQK